MKNALVVYYSITGHSATLAKAIAEVSGCKIGCIHDHSPRTSKWSQFCAVVMTWLGINPRIRYDGPHPREFDLIIIGGPVWGGRMAGSLRSFLTQYANQINSLAMFCAYGGSGGDKALARLGEVAGKTPIAALAVTDAQIANGEYVQTIKRWVDQLNIANPSNHEHHAT